MNILIASNQIDSGNPILKELYNVYTATYKEDNLNFFKLNVRQLIFPYRLISIISKSDIVNVHFSSYYTIPVIIICRLLNKKFITTFHGTDLHGEVDYKLDGLIKYLWVKLNRVFSLITFYFNDKTILVSRTLLDHIPKAIIAVADGNIETISLGINYNKHKLLDKVKCREKLHLSSDIKYFLFSSFSSQKIKRIDIADQIVSLLGARYKLLRMTDVKYEEVPVYLSAADYLLLTSDREGSPNIVREALAYNLPVFSVDAGDVFRKFGISDNCFQISRNPRSASNQINMILEENIAFNSTREKLKNRISMMSTATKYNKIYKKVYAK